jgi:hypothetical protein
MCCVGPRSGCGASRRPLMRRSRGGVSSCGLVRPVGGPALVPVRVTVRVTVRVRATVPARVMVGDVPVVMVHSVALVIVGLVVMRLGIMSVLGRGS